MKLPTQARTAWEMGKWALAVGTIGLAAWFFLIRPDAALRQAATSRAEGIVAETQTEAAEETLRIVVDHTAEVQTIHTRTEVTNDEILSAPGADQAVDPAVHAAGLRALCLQDGRDEPECASVLQPLRDGERPGG